MTQGSIIDRHSQSTWISLISANALRAVPRRDRAGAGIDEIVAGDAGAVALRQPSLDLGEAPVSQQLNTLLAALR